MDINKIGFWGWLCWMAAVIFTINDAMAQQPPGLPTVSNQTVPPGGTAVFEVSVSGTGPFSYQWIYNGVPIFVTNVITTVAGKSSLIASYSGDNGAATNAGLRFPSGVAVDSAGNFYIADKGNKVIRKVDTNNIITTVAGNFSLGGTYSGDGGAATNAGLYLPNDIAVDGAGNFYIADTYNNVIRRVDAAGKISTVAGNYDLGGNYFGDGGAATDAALFHPNGVALDIVGNLYIAENGNNVVRKVDTNGIITTVAGNYFLGGTYFGDGGAATNAGLWWPNAVAVDGLGNLYIADTGNQVIRKVDTNAIITTVAGNFQLGGGYAGDGGPATNGSLNAENGVALDSWGNVFIADSGNNVVRAVNPGGVITTVAGNFNLGGDYWGDGGAATNAALKTPIGAGMDDAGNLYIADALNGVIRKVSFANFLGTIQNGALTIPDVQANLAGSYQVIVSNPYGSITSSIVTLTVQSPTAGPAAKPGVHSLVVAGPGSESSQTVQSELVTAPSITTQPTNQTVIQGSNTTFTVVASGSPLNYQWKFNSTNFLTGRTNATLTLTNTVSTNAGYYEVVITNTAGSVTSSNVSLTVLTKPAISTQPASQTATQGSNVTFTVTATGGSLNYQWKFNGTNLPAGQTNATLTLTGVGTNNAGNYLVVVTNRAGSVTSSNALLAVIVPVVITAQPTNLTEVQGSNATFRVTATGTSLNYQWEFNGTTPLAGQTNATLTLTSVGTNNAGNYSAIITNQANSVTSAVVSLTVLSHPVIVTQPASQLVAPGSNAVFGVSATGGALTYQWKLNGTNLPAGQTNATLTLANVQTNNAGNYSVVITNVAGSVTSSNAVLTVVSPPVITAGPTNQTVAQGNSVSFGVTATGTLLNYQWVYNGTTPLAGQTNATLTLSSVSTNNAGNYSVVVTNLAGTATSSNALLTVIPVPVIIAGPTNQAVVQGGTAVFAVTVSGSSLTYQWRLNGTNLLAGSNSAALTVTNVSSSNAGTYSVIVTNIAGSATSSGAVLAVVTPPTITVQPVNQSVGAGSNATFSVTATGNSLDYQWVFNGTTPLAGQTNSTLTLTDVLPANVGSYFVVVTNLAGAVTSSNATLSLLGVPLITRQPPNTIAVIGTSALFDVSVSGSSPLSYQWLFDGLPLVQSNIITTVAGDYALGAGFYGDGSSALAAQLSNPAGVSVDGNGNIYIADAANNVIRRVTTNGIITTVAGNEHLGGAYSGDGGPATNAALNNPSGLVVDGSGDLYIADTGNNVIRLVDAGGVISTLAGSNSLGGGFSGDGMAATNAALNSPTSVARDNLGNLYIADSGNNVIRRVNSNGVIITVAGSHSLGGGYSGDGAVATNAALSYPTGVGLDNFGNLYIADNNNNVIREVNTSGEIATVAGNFSLGWGYSGDGATATNAMLNGPGTVTVDGTGNLYIADTWNNVIREVNLGGTITTVAGNGARGEAGDGGLAVNASLTDPYSATVDSKGNLLIADSGNNVVRRVALGSLSGEFTEQNGQLMISPVETNMAGNYQVIITNAYGSVTSSVATLAVFPPLLITTQPASENVGGGSNVVFIAAASGQAPIGWQWYSNSVPLAGATGSSLVITNVTAADTAGYFVVASNVVGSVTSELATLTVLASPAITSFPGNQTVNLGNGATLGVTAFGGDLTYEWFFKSPTLGSNIISTCAGVYSSGGGYAGDGGAATNAEMYNPAGLVADSAGNLYIADYAANVVRRVSASGQITTVAGNNAIGGNYEGDGGPATNAALNSPNALAVDGAGNLYICDSGNSVIREVNASGVISTVAGNYSLAGGYSGDGGAATNAALNSPQAVAVDSAGDLYITEYGNNVVREVNTAGMITTIAGKAALGGGYSGDGGPATNAAFNNPTGITLDGTGDLYISDAHNNVIRKVSAAGIITTVAGNSSLGGGYSGDGGPATNAAFNYPVELSVDGAGNLYCADVFNGVIRKVTPAGVITTVAGNFSLAGNYSGDGGPATNAALSAPNGVWVNGWGILYVGDTQNHVVRQLGLGGAVGAGMMTSGGLSLTSAESWQSGNYQLIISNPYGSVTSSIVSLTVQLPFLITTQPTNQTVVQGSNVVFHAAASSTPPFFWQWYSNSVPLAGFTSSNLTLVSVTTNEAAGYSVMVTNAGGALTSTVATLTVLSPPVIIAGLTNQMVNVGTNFTLGVTATGGNLAYRWLFNGYPIAVSNILSLVAGCHTNGYSTSGVATNVYLYEPFGIMGSGAGAFYLTDLYYSDVQFVNTNGNFSDFAGIEGANYSGNGGAATSAALRAPMGVAMDAAGNVYIADTGNNVVRKVSTNGIISAFAGNHTNGYSGNGLSATNAELSDPVGVAVDASGNVYISDSSNNVIRKVSSTGLISTFAGNHTNGFAGDGGLATSAELSGPQGIAVDSNGNVYIADFHNAVIRAVNAAGIITTVAGNHSANYSGDGGAATNASLNQPYAVAADPAGNLYIADFQNSVVREVNSAGTITTVAGNHTIGYSGNGGPPTSAAFNAITGVGMDAIGNLDIVDNNNSVIRRVPFGSLFGNGGIQNGLLTLTNVEPYMAGNYQVIITNVCGSVTSSVARLIVASPPVITVQPASQATVQGSNVTFSVTATGPALNYQWWFNGTTLLTGQTNATYTANSVAVTNAGNYFVVITNLYGSVTSSIVSLSVVRGNYTWVGTTATNWSASTNWSPAGVPGVGDQANILNGGTVSLSQNVIVGFVNLVSGTLNGAKLLSVSNAFTWSGGSLSCPVIIQTNALMTLSGSGTLGLHGVLTNAGTVDWSGTANLQLYNGTNGNTGGIVNLAGALFNIQNDETMSGSYGSEYFNNLGTIVKSPTTGTTIINVAFDNSGSVEVESGTINFNDGGSLAGSFQAAAGAAIYFTGGLFDSFANTVFQGPGVIQSSSATVLLTGSVTNFSTAGAFINGLSNTVVVGTLSLTNCPIAGPVTVLGTLNMLGGGINPGCSLLVASNGVLNLSGGVGLSGVLTNAGTVNWSGGADLAIYNDGGANTGGIVNLAGGFFNIENDQGIDDGDGLEYFDNAGTVFKATGPGATTFNVTFNNTGTVTLDRGTMTFNNGGDVAGTYWSAAGTTFTLAYGSFLANGSASIQGSGAVLVANVAALAVATNGVLTFGGNGTVSLQSLLSNAGTVNWTGTVGLNFYVDGYYRYTGGFLNETGAVFNAESDATMGGNAPLPLFNNLGTFVKSLSTGTNSINIAFLNNGSVSVDTGTLNFNSGGNVTGRVTVAPGAQLNFAGGTFNGGNYYATGAAQVTGGNFYLSGEMTVSNLVVTGGQISGSCVINGDMTWSGGSLSSQSTLTVASNAVLNLGGGGTVALYGLLSNEGTVNWTGTGSLAMYYAGPYYYSGGIVNQAGAVFNVDGDGTITNEYDYPSFNNFGSFIKSSTTGTTTFNIAFNNNGFVAVDSGTVNFNEGGSVSGNVTVAPGAQLNFAGGTFYGGNYNASGSAQFTGGTLNFGGAVTVSNLVVTGGTITGAGAISGQMVWSGGDLYGSLTIASNAVLYLGGNDTISLYGPLSNAGTVHWLGAGDLELYFSGPYFYSGGIDNEAGAVFDIENDSTIINIYGYPTFNNNGLVVKTPTAGVTTIDIAFGNAGTVLADSGTISFYGGGSLGGNLSAATNATLDFADGVFADNSPMFGGAGIVEQTGGSVGGVFGGTLEWSGGKIDLGVPLMVATNGVLNIDGTVSLLSVLTNAGTVNWSGAGDLQLTSYGYYSAGIDNLAGAVFNAENDETITNEGGAEYFNNAGSFVKFPTWGTTVVGITFNNTGSVQAQTGTILFSAGGDMPASVQSTNLPIAPAFTEEPSSTNILAGADAAFTATASGSIPLFWQWYSNSVPLMGANSPRLSFSGATTNETASYFVVVTNVAGCATSSIVSLTVNYGLPEIVSQPVGVAVLPGSNAVFTVMAGGGGLQYQWWEGATNRLAGATNNTLTFINVQSTNTGNYFVIVTNSFGSATSSLVSLSLIVPPVITLQPAGQTIGEGSNAVFTVAATGGALNYLWLLNGVPLPGATGASLVINDLQSADAGLYSVAVTNLAGSVTSFGAMLSVLIPPVITTQPVSETVAVNSNATFNVTASGGNLNYTWYVNGTNFVAQSTNSVLVLTNAQITNEGFYDVVVSNVEGSVTSSNALLTVCTLPVITSQPANQTIVQGGGAAFSVAATGGALNYQWSLNGAPLAGATNASLTLANVQTAGTNLCAVAVTNLAGSATSSNAVLLVLVPPVITMQPVSLAVSTNGTATFSVTTTGNDLNYQWWFDGTNQLAGATNSVVTLSNVQMTNAGLYNVVVNNLAGTVTSSNALLTVCTLPEIVAQPAGLTINQNQNAAFNVTAAGNALTYFWLFNGTILVTAGPNPNLMLADVPATEAGNYSVVVSNVVGTATSTSAPLTVLPPLLFPVQPTNQQVVAGLQNAAFIVTGTGTGPLTWQWYSNNVPVPGATTNFLTFADPTNAGVSDYYVVLANNYGSVTSDIVTLDVEAQLADSDYDGRNNVQELLTDGTDPFNPASVTNIQLSYLPFDNTNGWTASAGQVPLTATNIVGIPSWDTNAVWIDSTNPAILCYRDVETNGNANINLRNGTVSFWFKPDWSSVNVGGSGPGGGGGLGDRLLEMGAYNSAFTNGWWSLYVTPDGNQMIFGSSTNGSGGTNLAAPILLTTNQWCLVTLTYTPTNSILYVNSQFMGSGGGPIYYPNVTERAAGFTIGSDAAGHNQGRGVFDDLATYNYPLSPAAISTYYQACEALDSGGGGMDNILANQLGLNPYVYNSPYGLTTTNGLKVFTPLN